jgi:hypothetical protein
MSEQIPAKKRSRRTPAASAETSTIRAPVEDVVSGLSESRTESPVDPKSTATYRLGLAAVIGLGVVILVVLAVMVFGISQGWGHRDGSAAAPAAKKPVSMTLAPGYRILSSDTQPGRLVLRVRSDSDDEIWVINTDDGSIVARIHGEAPKQ